MILPQTIRDGQAALLWSTRGTRRIVVGPKVLFAPFEKMELLNRVTARDGEYLEIQFEDGTTENRPGPCETWLDPLLHSRITVRKALNLDAHHAIVIYREHEDGAVTHRVLRGPALYVPGPNEWLHEFLWHGDKGSGLKLPRALAFKKLRVIPDQMYGNVEDVRTSDEALIRVRVMVFFELVDIERMLAMTHDPVADFINALSADVIRFAGRCKFEGFKTRAAALNDLATYPELTTGAERIGYRISKVVYRGYQATSELQKMHDDAIETRTGLVLEAETEERRQEIADLQQKRSHERAALGREEEERSLAHQLRQNRESRMEDLSDRREREELELQLSTQRHEADEAHRRALLDLRAEEWQRLQQSGADLTAVLVAQERNPDKLIRLEQEANSGNGIHLHEAV